MTGRNTWPTIDRIATLVATNDRITTLGSTKDRIAALGSTNDRSATLFSPIAVHQLCGQKFLHM